MAAVGFPVNPRIADDGPDEVESAAMV